MDTVKPLRPIILATDASRDPRKAACGWVKLDTKHKKLDYGHFPIDVRQSEIIAAQKTLKRQAKGEPTRHIILLCDSMLALKSVHKSLGDNYQNLSLELRWVKGHQGHILNNVADLLAKAGRTSIPEDMALAEKKIQNIRDKFLHGDWEVLMEKTFAYTPEFEQYLHSVGYKNMAV